jgi:hypothetical protein
MPRLSSGSTLRAADRSAAAARATSTSIGADGLRGDCQVADRRVRCVSGPTRASKVLARSPPCGSSPVVSDAMLARPPAR